MSETYSRRLRPKDVAMLVKSGGDFTEETRFAPESGGGFVPWGKTKFKVVKVEEALNSNEPQDAETVASPAQDEANVHAEGQAPELDHMHEQAAVTSGDVPSVAPPAGPQDIAPSSADIIAEIDKAREDGRVIGYQQGVAAGRQEFEAALDVLRRLEERIIPLADEAISKIPKSLRVMSDVLRKISLGPCSQQFLTPLSSAFIVPLKHSRARVWNFLSRSIPKMLKFSFRP